MQTSDIIPKLKQSFDTCELLDGAVARCEHKFQGRLRSIYFVKAMDSLPESEAVANIQSNLVAPSYFSSREEIRWNHYLVFVVPEGVDAQRKSSIESDRSYSRKLVVPFPELDAFLERGLEHQFASTQNANALQQVWSTCLREAGIAAVDSDQPRAAVVRAIRHGANLTSSKSSNPVVDTQPLAFLRYLDIRSFGSRRIRGRYTFGRVNLIRGVNGVGKTSLLEAVEHFLCGATARAKAAEHFDASAVFTNSDREIAFQARPASYYQQRDLKWYGRKIAQRNRLYEGFARYNFLSADAAVDFSRDEEQHDLAAVLSKVALGPDAAFTWDRIQQVYGDIGPLLGPLYRDIAGLESRAESAQARLSALLLPAPETTSRTTHVLGILSDLGWGGDSQESSPQTWFEYAARLRIVLDSAPDELPPEFDSLDSELSRIDEHLEKIRDLEAGLRASRARIAEADITMKSLDSLGRSLKRLSDYEQVDFAGLMAKIAEANQESAFIFPERDSVTKLRNYIVSQVDLGLEESSSSIGDILSSLRAYSGVLKQRLDTLVAELNIASSRAHSWETKAAQLKELGLQLAHEHPEDGCPLCRTQMDAVELISRIENLLVNVQAHEMARMEEERSHLMARLSETVDAQALAESFIGINASSKEQTVSQLLMSIDDADSERARGYAQRHALLASMRDREASGFNVRELMGLLGRCAEEIDPAFNQLPLASDLLKRADAVVTDRRAKLNAELSDLRETDQESSKRLAELLVLVSGEHEIGPAKSSLLTRASALRQFKKALTDLPPNVATRARSDLHAFVDTARIAYTQISNLSEELRTRQSRDAEVAALNEEIQASTLNVARLRSERDNLQNAHRSLEMIIREHSLERGLTDFLSSNLTSIQSIFRRIHAPNELRLSNLSGCELVRVADGQSASLAQISTGQRAALVLSVFLTLNMSLRSGPPMLLVDDPIAHVDDLNALALLDYLADIAESGRRQIFFATADEKLANLFAKKMAFLSEQFSIIEFSRTGKGDSSIH